VRVYIQETTLTYDGTRAHFFPVWAELHGGEALCLFAGEIEREQALGLAQEIAEALGLAAPELRAAA
jgi:hypothetical protein